MFNINRKSNIVGRLIAGLLICVTFVLAMPQINAMAGEDDYGDSNAEVNIIWYQTVSAEVTADENGKVIIQINVPNPEEGRSSDSGQEGLGSASISTNFDHSARNWTVVIENIKPGTDGYYYWTDKYGEAMAGTAEIHVLGRRKENNISINAQNFTYGPSTVTKTVESMITMDNSAGAVVTCTKTGSIWDGAGYTIQPTETPIVPGSYSISVTVPYNATYKSASASATFTVDKYTPSLSVPDITNGGEIHPTYSIMDGEGHLLSRDDNDYYGLADIQDVYIQYKGENEDEWSMERPTEAGTYTARLFYGNDLGYNLFNKDVSTTFKIALKEGKGTVTVKDTVYGESSVKPEAKSDTNDADKAEFFYKVKNTDDSTYIKDRPTKPGNYVCKAVFPKTGDYDKCEATCIFTIDRGKGVGSLTASDVYVGMEPKTTATSATNGTTAVKYYYKEKSEDASKYTDKLPTKPGEYTVKAVFPMTDYYYETSAEANFKTSYMPAPTFGLTGKQGKNDFYTDTVSVKAPAGYEVSLSYGKDYKDSINILDGVKYVYFKDKATGALSDKTAVPSYKMDSVLPVVKGVKNNDTIFKDEYELEVTDDYLEMVKVNDQTIPVKDGKATYKLTSDSGEMLYKIEATDQAGHTVTYTITVASPWVKDGFVPAGQIVKLKPGKAYSLKGGKKYKIKGDDTVYNGGTQFYVDEERELELEEYNEN